MARHYTSKAGMAMQYVDPWITNFAAGAARMAGVNPNDPSAMRQQMYNTAAGQGALDIATLMRSNGLLGQGNPMAYSYHVAKGITSGGFGVQGLSSAGMPMGPMQTVYGSGPLADQVTMATQKQLLQNLYGSGTADPSKLNGANMETAGFIFSDLARNGGMLRNGVSIKQNASFEDRYAASMYFNQDSTIGSALQGMSKAQRETMGSIASRGGDQSEIDSFTSGFDNAKVRAELSAIIKAKDAIVPSADLGKPAAAAIKEITKSMASLRDVYEGMSDPMLYQQMQALTGISGGKMIDPMMGRKAGLIINKMKGAAEASGYDTQVYMDAMSGITSGMDAGASNFIGMRSGFASGIQKNTAAQFSAYGVAMGTPDMRAAGMDMRQQSERGAMIYDGIKALYGGIARITDPARRAIANKLLKDFETNTDPIARQNLNREAKALLGAAFGGFTNYTKTKSYSDDMGRMRDDIGGIAERFEGAILAESTATINPGELTNVMGSDAIGFIKAAGTSGTARLEDISRSSNIPKDQKMAQMMTIMQKDYDVSKEDAARMLGKLYDKDGAFKGDEETRKAVLASIVAAVPNEAGTAAGKLASASKYIGDLDKSVNDSRGAMGNDMSLKGIINAFISGKTGMLDSDEGKMLLMQSMKNDGMKIMGQKGPDGKTGKDYTDQVLSGMDLENGLTGDMVSKINKAVGGDFNLASAAGYKDADELIAASKTDVGLANIIEKLQGNAGIVTSGGRKNFNIASKAALDDFGATGQDARMKEFMLARKFINPNASAKDVDALAASFKAGEDLDVGLVADEFASKKRIWGSAAKSSGGWGPPIASSQVVQEMAQFDTVRDTVGRLNSGSNADLTTLMSTASGKQMLDSIKKQRNTLATTLGSDTSMIVNSVDSESGKVTSESFTQRDLTAFDETIKKMEAAMSVPFQNATFTNANIHVAP